MENTKDHAGAQKAMQMLQRKDVTARLWAKAEDKKSVLQQTEPFCKACGGIESTGIAPE